MLMRELKWVGAEGPARRKRTEQARDRRGEVTSGGWYSHSLPEIAYRVLHQI